MKPTERWTVITVSESEPSDRTTKTVTIAYGDQDKDSKLVESTIATVRQIPGMAVWEDDETRTNVVENGKTDEIHIDGVEDDGSITGRVAIDYATDPPRVIVHGDPIDEEPTDVIPLEPADEE